MKRTSIIFVAVSVLLYVISCTREVNTSEPGPVLNHAFSIDALLPELEQGVEGRGTFGSFVSASWSEGDELSVVNITTGKVLAGTLTADRGGTVSTFSGTVRGIINAGDRISLFYPAIENQSEDEFDFVDRTISIAAQDRSSGVPLVATGTFTAGTAVGEYSGIKLNFEYGVSYLKINLANLPCISGGCEASKVTLRNISTQVTYSIDSTNSGFVISTPEERTAKGLIEVTGPFEINENGILMMSVAVVPADSALNRVVEVSVDGDGEYSAPLTPAKLNCNRYYNVVSSKFEKTGIAGVDAYGAYCLSGETLDGYEQYGSSVITGTEAGERDFTLVHNASGIFWSIKGLPESAEEWDCFTARFISNGVSGYPYEPIEGAKVVRITEDGDFSKLWITAHDGVSDYLFIIRR